MSEVTNFEPKEDVFSGRIGRRLDDGEGFGFEQYRQQLQPGEIMYVGLREGVGQAPTCLLYANTPRAYEFYYGRFDCGMYAQIDIYAIPDEVVHP